MHALVTLTVDQTTIILQVRSSALVQPSVKLVVFKVYHDMNAQLPMANYEILLGKAIQYINNIPICRFTNILLRHMQG